MSAYAAFKAQDERERSPFTPPEPKEELLTEIVAVSAFKYTPLNSIFTANSVFLGLAHDDHIVVNGAFDLTVHRGATLVNNIHRLKRGKTVSFVSSTAQSLPVICALKHDDKGGPGYLEGFETVLELANLHTGLHKLGAYCGSLGNMYFSPKQYTFQIVLEHEENLCGIHYDRSTLKCLNSLTQVAVSKPQSVFVLGAKNCGKSTFTKTLLNNVVLATEKEVAYLDMDPGQSEFSVPWTLSLTVHSEPCFQPFLPKENEKNRFCYYGFNSPAELPDHYVRCCKFLFKHYEQNFKPQGIPLVINTPGWIRGFGKELLIEITSIFNPLLLVYLTHNNSVNLQNFEPDEFEAQDNPDDEVLADLTYQDLSVLRGTRRASKFSAALLRIHNKLLYFHRLASKFDFSQHTLAYLPLKLSYTEKLAAICVLAVEQKDLNPPDVLLLVEASIMALCLIHPSAFPNVSASSPPYMNGDDFTSIDLSKTEFAGLCMVHSVNTKDRYLNLYLPGNYREISAKIERFLAKGYKLVLVRGDGELPAPEIVFPGLLESGRQVPYVSLETRSKIGGVWKVRKNIGRKNQQK